MSESAKFSAQNKKLQGVCDEHDLVFRFEKNTYPVTLTVSPSGGAYQQMSLLETSEEDKGNTSPDAKIVFYFTDGELAHDISGKFSISGALFLRIKNIYQRMHYFWLQILHREIVERQLLKSFPEIEDADEVPDYSEDDEGPAMVTTVDNSGIVTHVEFPGDGDSDDYDYQEPGEESEVEAE